MNFFRKILLLKQVEKGFSIGDKELGGIVRVEHEDQNVTLSLSLINFSAFSGKGYFCTVVFENNPPEYFLLDKKPACLIKVFSSLSPFSDFSVGIFSFEENNQGKPPLLVAFGKTEKGCSIDTLKNLTTFTGCEKQCNEIYDDEAVATENYFSLDDGINEKIKLIDGWDNEKCKNENTFSDIESQKNQQEGNEHYDCLQNEKDGDESKVYSREFPYIKTARPELEELFSKFPVDLSLSSIFPESRFCKISYDADKYYVVGTVMEKEQIKYVCYGVPGVYSPTPPKELENYCSFVPLSIFDLHGSGFWMMFQDAITGKCIKK